MSDDAFARKLAELSATFRAELPARLDEMRGFAVAGRFDELRAVAHQLAGRGGTFGAPDISVAARALEESPDSEVQQALEGLASTIEAMA